MSVNSDAQQDRTRGARSALWQLAGPWWLFLLTGIAWLIIAWVALRFTPASIATVGALLGVLFLFGMADEQHLRTRHAAAEDPAEDLRAAHQRAGHPGPGWTSAAAPVRPARTTILVPLL